jgi:hypothetical protein
VGREMRAREVREREREREMPRRHAVMGARARIFQCTQTWARVFRHPEGESIVLILLLLRPLVNLVAQARDGALACLVVVAIVVTK